ncbi:MAG TPA: hypothetical protein VFW76_12375 [Ktedonobacterales bacterium]|jgi:uncharacterized membrane protein|nr:hypothetical protein [Ktedonobacterales bacterium]
MGDQPNYGQPPMQSQSAGAKWGPTSMGMEAHIAAGLGYFFSPILPLIFFLIEKNNRFVKFHAMQSILLGAAYVIFFVVLFIIQGVILVGSTAADSAAGSTGLLATGGGLIGCLLSCLYFVGALGFLALVIWGMVAGFTGKYTKLPIVGNLAEKWAGGPAQPAY